MNNPNVLIICDPDDRQKRAVAIAWLEREMPEMLRDPMVIYQTNEATDVQLKCASIIIFPTPADYLRLAGRELVTKRAIVVPGTDLDTRDYLHGGQRQRGAVAVFDAILEAALKSQPVPAADPEKEKLRRDVETLATEVNRLDALASKLAAELEARPHAVVEPPPPVSAAGVAAVAEVATYRGDEKVPINLDAFRDKPAEKPAKKPMPPGLQKYFEKKRAAKEDAAS